jgi:hypothetical protein
MSEQALDPFADGRTSLRDTVKWLVGIASGLGAALAAGVSFSALASLDGTLLQIAMALGALSLLAVLLSIRELLKVLLVKPFTIKQLSASDRLKAAIEDSSVLPYDVENFAALLRLKDEYAKAVKSQPANQTARDNLKAASDAVGKALSLASFYDLSDTVNEALTSLFVFSVILVLCVGGIGFTVGLDKTSDRKNISTAFSPGDDWRQFSVALSERCGVGPFQVTANSIDLFPHWVRVTLSGPGQCAGVSVDVPDALVAARP